MNYIDIATGAYPITEKDIRQAFPNTSFPSPFQPPEGYAPVTEVNKPTSDPTTQRVVEKAPQVVNNVWLQVWEVQDLSTPEVTQNLTNQKIAAIAGVDADVDKIYAAVIGNRAEEYRMAEQEASAFAAAGYTGTVPMSVQTWADATGWTTKDAANDILKTSAQWRGAQGLIRSNRLKSKEKIRAATTIPAVNAEVSNWRAFVIAAKSQLGI